MGALAGLNLSARLLVDVLDAADPVFSNSLRLERANVAEGGAMFRADVAEFRVEAVRRWAAMAALRLVTDPVVDVRVVFDLV